MVINNNNDTRLTSTETYRSNQCDEHRIRFEFTCEENCPLPRSHTYTVSKKTTRVLFVRLTFRLFRTIRARNDETVADDHGKQVLVFDGLSKFVFIKSTERVTYVKTAASDRYENTSPTAAVVHVTCVTTKTKTRGDWTDGGRLTTKTTRSRRVLRKTHIRAGARGS